MDWEESDLPKGLASSNAGMIARRLGTVSGGRVLDVATGGGAFIETLMKTLKDFDSFVGVDYCPSDASREEMESARKRFEGKPVRLLQMNAERLEFEDGSFDTVCISYSMHHLANIDAVLAEMMRVLRPGGCFILQEPYSDGDQTEAQKADRLQHEWGAKIDTLRGITHNETFSRERIIGIVRSLDLSELEVYDSTHSVDCLFCDRRYECEDPKNHATYHDSIEEIDEYMRMIEDYPDAEIRDCLKEEGERIKETIARVGLSSASYRLLIGRT
jgi:ubiquinone/menaquinone biosynthesis C-methylase UbiE